MAKRPVRTKPNSTPRRKPQLVSVKKRPFKQLPIQDARQKLIQKKRLNVKDARDVIAKLAQRQDARAKLNKLRQKRNGNIKVIGHNILQKTDRDGKIVLMTKKTKAAAVPIAGPNIGMNAAIQKELGLIPTPKKRQARAANDPAYGMRFDSTVYKWAKPGLRPATASQMIGSLEARAARQGWQSFPITKPLRLPHSYVDLDAVEDEEMPLVPMKQTISLQGSSRISNIHSRLDNSPFEQETHGIFGQPKTKVVVPAGHRIVVSNLQSSVTQDDVKELFEDIGQLLAARLVRPGVAEVIYKNLKDAQEAVDTYHNRQLDGQPMKCLLVNKRPLNNPTAPPLTKIEAQGLIKTLEVSSSVNSNKLVPDLSTIHKVLFQRK